MPDLTTDIMLDIGPDWHRIAEARRRLVSGSLHDRQDAIDLLRDVIEQRRYSSRTGRARCWRRTSDQSIAEALHRLGRGDEAGALDAVDDALRLPKWGSEADCRAQYIAAMGERAAAAALPSLYFPEAA